MVGYTAGSVSAKIELDTTEFKKAIEEVKKQVASLNGSFKGASIESMANDVEKLKKEVNGLKDSSKAVKDLTGKTNKLEDAVKKTSKSVEQLNKAYKSSNQSAKTQQKNLDGEIKKNKQLKDATKATEKTVEALNKERANTVKTSKKEQQTLDNTIKKTKQEIKVNEQLNKSLKNTAVQQKKLSKIDKQFISDFVNTTNKYKNKGKNNVDGMYNVRLEPIFNELKKKYKPYVKSRKEFERLFQNLEYTGAKLGRASQATLGYGKGKNKLNSVHFKSLRGANRFAYVNTEHMKSLETIKKEIKSTEKEIDTLNSKKVDLNTTPLKQDTKVIDETKKSINQLNKETQKTGSSKGVKQFLTEFAKADTGIKRTTQETENLIRKFASLNRTNAQSQQSVANATKKSVNESAKAREKNIQRILKETEAASKLNIEQRQAGLTAKRNMRIFKKMEVEASKYFNGLKRGRRAKGVNGTDSALWAHFIGNKERTKTFDIDRYSDHMRDTFADIVPNDVFDKMYQKLNKKYGIGLVGWNADRGGIHEDKLKWLSGKEQYAKDIKYYNELAKMADIPPELLRHNMRKAGTALDMFDKQLEQSKKAVKNYITAWGEVPIAVNRSSNEINNAIRKFASIDYKSQKTALNDYLNTWSNGKISVKRSADEINNAIRKFAAVDYKSPKWELREYLDTWSNASISVKRSVDEIETAMRKFVNLNRKGYVPIGGDLFRQYSNNWETTNTQIKTAMKSFATFERKLRSTEVNVKGFDLIYYHLGDTINTNNANIKNALNVLKIYDGGVEKSKQRLKEYEIQTKKTFETMQVELAKANAAQYKYWKQIRGQSSRQQIVSQVGKEQIKWDTTSFNKQPLQIQGYNDYLVKIEEINTALEKWKRTQQSINDLGKYTSENFVKASQGLNLLNQQIEKSNAIINKNQQSNAKLGSQIQRLNTQINHLSGSSGKNFRAFEEVNIQVKQLENRYNSLNNKLKTGKVTNEQYAASMEKMEKEFSELYTKTQLVNKGLQQSGKNLDKFGKGTKNAAHSSRILSNTLYQIRGALLSLKMIFTAMGGMALWGFGMQLVEEVKDTVTAKNEMVAQLNQNSKIDASGIQYFTKSLDDLTKRFKKVNKYSIGETVSSLGIEFNLTAEEMKKAMPIITMVQSEYIRAGRTPEEAALAVKDILQGEFQRLSRETGVGKEELIAYGWNGKKEDLNSLLKAVDKAGKARHWDVFAQKATSLNDVLTITQSRFSETGAEILDSATPMIVEAFNILIGTIEGVSNSFSNLNPFWQNFALWGGGSAVLGGILTALPMVTKGMGLADIATIGWGKSIATAALNLNKAEVAQYGFRKALAATITGTKASEISTMRSSKAILGRIMGLDALTLKEKGWLGSMVKNKASLKEGIKLTAKDSAYTMSRAKKLAYLTTNIDLNTAKSLKQGEAIRKVATSWRIWRTALLGVVGIGIIGFMASLGMQADLVKKRIEAFNEIVATGKDKLKEAKDQLKTYTEQMEKYKKGTIKYDRAKANKEIMEGTVSDLKTANGLVKAYKKQNEAREESITLAQKQFRAEALRKAGNDPAAATEKASGYTDKIRQAQYEITRSYNEQYNWLYKSSQHINEHVEGLKKEGVALEQRNKYISEYTMVAEEAGEHLKQFYQGDLLAGAYHVLDRAKLVWIDLWNDSHFLNFWKSVQNTWKGLQPILRAITKSLGDLGHFLLDVFSTGLGQTVLQIGLFGGAIGLVVGKIGKWITGAKSTVSALKNMGSALVNRIRDWNNYRKAKQKAEEADILTGKGKGKSTGGTLPEGTGKGKEVESLSKQLKADAQRYLRAGVAIFAGMMLITEAIVLIRAPMAAVAEQGWQFKQWEPEIRKGIEGLKLMAPVLLTFLPPVIALVTVMGKFDEQISSSTIVKGSIKAAVGIAAGMLLVAEAIALITPSIWALGYLGSEYQGLETQVKKGTQAMKTVADSLNYLAPFIPVLVLAVSSMALLFSGGGSLVGGIALASVALGIPVGMLMVAETIWSLEYPLNQIATLGGKFDNLDGVKKGAEAIEVVSEAMKYVESALTTMATIEWTLISDAIAKLIGIKIGADFNSLSEEGGFFDQLNGFVKGFNSTTIEPIDSEKVTAMSNSATGIESVKTALVTVKESLKNLPNFETDNRTTDEKYKDAVSGQEATSGVSNYFEQLKEPITQLNSFIKKFNKLEVEPVDTAKVSVIQSSANAIATINSAIENVKTAMGNAIDTQWAANTQSSGLLGAGLNLLVGNMGQSSPISSGLDQLYNSVKDIMEFNTKIAGLTSEGSGDTSKVEGASNMVSALQTQINSLTTTLNASVPVVKTAATGMGTNIVSGFKDGLKDLGSSITKKIDEVAPTAETKAESLGKDRIYPKFKSGIDKMSESMGWELYYVGKAIDDKKPELGDKAYALGEHMANRFKEGNDMHSPGIMARSMQDEVGYIADALNINNLPQMAYDLANSIGSRFNVDFGLSNIQLPDVSAFTNKLSVIPSTVTNVKTQVTTGFNAMKTGISGAFTNIIAKTRGSMGNMLSATTKNIGAIRTSWKGMQSALIASAENIKTQTSSKIDKLKTNLGNFWNKLKHPDQLIGSAAGGHTGSIRRRSHAPRIRAYAGGSNSYPSSNKDTDFIRQYLQCLSQGGNCYAGGWHFNWNKKIQGKFNGWDTHFDKWNLDNHLKVGKFSNTSSPIKNLSQSSRAEIAKDYIFDVISGTDYSKYFNSKFGEDPVAALRAGAFNCWDGTNVILGIASAFGLKGAREHGTWNGIGHVWANIPGIGIIDPTAIQKRGTFKSSAVKGYGAGSIRRGEAKQKLPTGNTTNHNEEVHIHIHGDVYGVDDLDNRIEQGAKRVQRRLFTNSYSGV